MNVILPSDKDQMALTVNGKTILNPGEYIKEIVFDDVDCDGHSSGRGIVKNIKVEK